MRRHALAGVSGLDWSYNDKVGAEVVEWMTIGVSMFLCTPNMYDIFCTKAMMF